jgi:DNA-3-methyladenine glycosylase I
VSTYCDFAPGHPVHGPYHDSEYGFPQREESVLFERLVLEINQAGLSWETILRKRDGFRRAYDGFDVDAVADYGARDRKRLLADPGIIRNRLKIEAAIHNAGVIRAMRDTHGGFAAWLDAHAVDSGTGQARDKTSWVKLFRGTFRFTGGEITGEFLMSLGYLPGAHHADCPVAKRIAALKRRKPAGALARKRGA